MDKIKNYILNNKFNICLIILWLIITGFTMFNHEIWRDEAQVWCLVRDTNIFELFSLTKTEGHPILWYLLNLPLAKSGLSVFSMQILSLIFVFASVILFTLKSPFNKIFKTIFVLSSGMIYYLPVISRNYSLIPIFLFLIALIYDKRNKKPYIYSILIILLSQTHIYMLGFCIALFILFSFENVKKFLNEKNTKIVIPNLILLLHFTVMFFIFYNSNNSNYALEAGVRQSIELTSLLTLISKTYFYEIVKPFPFLYNNFGLISNCLFYIPILIIMFFFFKEDKKTALTTLFGTGFMLFVFYKIYFNGILYQKLFVLLLIFVFGYWIIKEKINNKVLELTICILFCFSTLISYPVIKNEIQYNFSGGKQTAEYIIKNLPDVKTFIAIGNPFVYSSISAYLPDKKIYNVISNSYITYYGYKNNNKINDEYPENANYYIVQKEQEENIIKTYLEEVFTSDKNNLSSKTEQETFKIFKDIR